VDAARHMYDELNDGLSTRPVRYEVFYTNLKYASPDELVWVTTATARDLRAAARMKPDRTVVIDGVERAINPFWYSPILGL